MVLKLYYVSKLLGRLDKIQIMSDPHMFLLQEVWVNKKESATFF